MHTHTHTHRGSHTYMQDHTHTMPIKSSKYIAFENHYSVANTLKLIIPIRLSFEAWLLKSQSITVQCGFKWS